MAYTGVASMTSRITAAAGVPHVPTFPQLVAAGDGDIAERYAAVRRVLHDSQPSLMAVVANDHLNTYFLDRLPTFAIALGDALRGPIDQVPGIEAVSVRTDPVAAAAIAEHLVATGFDLTLSLDVELDHSVVVPLHFLGLPDVPVVVLHVNGYVRPLPAAGRCHRLGVAFAEAVTCLPGDRRVAVVASGSFSQEVGGPRVDPGRHWSVPRPDWAARVSALLAAGDVETIVHEATPKLIADAGSVAGELLSWLVLAGAAASLAPSVDYRPGEAFAFASWSGE
ncbi:hypothetical protein [Mesorhizobium sp. M6A.T.Ce.TU.016.01.1.1]|uniref:DODA-type extradiol aromatic ring-opening family dioxygenase n=1 Tax=Mesorhizobium sp. M6A.T.Ce.TU.016.01.1.1 TaxID=2496783 RepID=UPI000FC9DC79|nr:hypothetical protein [Mesorhizobium sp. M6A.T.Ce.TU.016.01.1.1]RUU32405.1 hypothetical protein EOC94_02800 [Mesorhizobium sp. M6A.T.Ce.TU.016.01.1.1]